MEEVIGSMSRRKLRDFPETHRATATYGVST
jgi:hypothetical protein